MAGNTPLPGARSVQPSQPASTGRTRPSRATGLTPVSWLFVGVAIVLIGVLTYYLTLTARPEISDISPQPNSVHEPGPVQLEAVITSQRDIEEFQLSVDGTPVDASIEQTEQDEWTVAHEQVFDRGEREVVLEVVDTSGRSAEHSWTFEAGGELIPPRLALVSPPNDVPIEPGTNGIQLHLTTFAGIEHVEIEIGGEPVDAQVEEAEPASEYTVRDDMPIFEWNVSAVTDIPVGTAELSVFVQDDHGASSTETWEISVAPAEQAEARFFEETEYYVAEPFLTYWEENVGDAIIGPPVGPPLRTEAGEEHQYFQFARLELSSDGDVQRGLIGREIFGEPETPPDRPPGDGSRLFDPTGHYVYGVIREFWEDNGGLAVFGYPLSQEFETEDGYAQYFERALIQVTETNQDDRVELAPLGEQLYREYQRGVDERTQSTDDAAEDDPD